MELTRPVEAERRNEGSQLIAKILRRLLAHDGQILRFYYEGTVYGARTPR
jgi:hypothetical protein